MGITNNSEHDVIVSGSFTANAQTLDIVGVNRGSESIQVTGTWVGTIIAEASNDNTNWIQLTLLVASNNTKTSKITSNNIYILNSSSTLYVRLRTTSWTSGTATITKYGNDSPSVINSTQGGNWSMAVADSQSMDPVGRLRVSDVANIGSYCFYSGIKSLDFNSSLTGSGTVTFVANSASTRLSTTTASGDSVIRQTKRYFSYAPGIGHEYGIAITVGAAKTNVRKRWGHFEENDGTFFEQTATDLAIVVRTSTSGSPVDTRTVQSSWNLDKLDGTGPSGITLNLANHNKFCIDMSWYGAGRVRFGIFYNGQTIYCHEFNGANNSTLPYTRTPKLPLRVELTNTGATASTTNVDLICLSATQEASAPRLPTYDFSKSMGRTGLTVSGTLIPLLSLQPTATFNGITNRSSIFPKLIEGLTNQQAVLIQLILNPTLTGASFSSVNALSCAQTDTSATAVSGGTVVAEFYIPSTSSEHYDLTDFSETLTLSTNIAGSAGDILTVAAISTAGNSTTWVALQWHEAQ